MTLSTIIDALEAEKCNPKVYGYGCTHNSAIDDCKRIVAEHYPSWQPIADAKPELMEVAIIGRSADAGVPAVQQCVWSGEYWFSIGLCTTRFLNPTHWMPLPAPPEGL